MNRTIAIVLLVAVGIYCLPTLLAIIGTVLGIIVGVAGAIFGVGISLLFSVLPYVILAYVIWWLVREKRCNQA
jgi:hypothetical protein